MGDTRRIRKKFKGPSHPFQRARIEAEKGLKKDYGLVNKQEIWKMASIAGKIKHNTKRLVMGGSRQLELERTQLIQKLKKLGLLKAEAAIEDALSIDTKNILERRLQTLVYRKELAKSMKQARQLVVHGHIGVGDKVVTSPSYIVSVAEEGFIGFRSKSGFSDPNHPERFVKKPEVSGAATETKKEEKKEFRKNPGRNRKPRQRRDNK